MIHSRSQYRIVMNVNFIVSKYHTNRHTQAHTHTTFAIGRYHLSTVLLQSVSVALAKPHDCKRMTLCAIQINTNPILRMTKQHILHTSYQQTERHESKIKINRFFFVSNEVPYQLPLIVVVSYILLISSVSPTNTFESSCVCVCILCDARSIVGKAMYIFLKETLPSISQQFVFDFCQSCAVLGVYARICLCFANNVFVLLFAI